ncbi:MAG: hypothetical protein MJ211_11305 [Bacteroidales bacterium]|nr:hypothetical protein [Bacteroidales bacterium]
MSKSDVYINNFKTLEYKLYNNNNKQYYWLKKIKGKQILLYQQKYNNILYQKQENKIRISINADWQTTNETHCTYDIFIKNNVYYLREKWEKNTLYFIGEEIKLLNIDVLKYNYKIPKITEEIKIEDTKEYNKIEIKEDYYVGCCWYILLLAIIINLYDANNGLGVILFILILLSPILLIPIITHIKKSHKNKVEILNKTIKNNIVN